MRVTEGSERCKQEHGRTGDRNREKENDRERERERVRKEKAHLRFLTLSDQTDWTASESCVRSRIAMIRKWHGVSKRGVLEKEIVVQFISACLSTAVVAPSLSFRLALVSVMVSPFSRFSFLSLIHSRLVSVLRSPR